MAIEHALWKTFRRELGGPVVRRRIVGDRDVVCPLDERHVGDLVDLLDVAHTEAVLEVRPRDLRMPPVAEVHDGYFAKDAKGQAKEIQVDKMRLLDIDEPLRFIFSHSALGEGWDNPNVFVICNLQDGKSMIRKRQQIGRGMRLPVMSNGFRWEWRR